MKHFISTNPSFEKKFPANIAIFVSCSGCGNLPGKFRQALQFGEQTMQSIIALGHENIFSLKIVDATNQSVKGFEYSSKLLNQCIDRQSLKD